MSRWLMIFLFTIVSGNFLFAQGNVEIKGTGANLYVEHSVAPKESLYSVGRMYNVSPQEIATYNHIKIADGLKIGQALNIPLTKNNFTQTGAVAKTEVLVPVYHNVVAGETLYRLGVNYDKVPLASLKKWNHLQSDEVIVGTPMIVGYLKVDKNHSVLASKKAAPAAEIVSSKVEEKQVQKQPEPVPVTVTPAKAAEPAKTDNNNVTVAQTDEHTVTVKTVNTKSNINFSGGYFKNLYDHQVQDKTPLNNAGNAGVFKSTSGWQDGKYYCFNNDATPGTIVKITDNASGKSVYAKVLDAIPDIKQNSGLSIVISNAAAEELGPGETRFSCELSYVK